jgi:ribosome-binding factor A
MVNVVQTGSVADGRTKVLHYVKNVECSADLQVCLMTQLLYQDGMLFLGVI